MSLRSSYRRDRAPNRRAMDGRAGDRRPRMPGWTRCSSATTTRPAPCTSRTPPMLGRLLAAWDPDVAGALFLLPLWNPVLVAEQIGTLAALTSGRFVMQCGIGAGRAQFAAMGVDVVIAVDSSSTTSPSCAPCSRATRSTASGSRRCPPNRSTCGSGRRHRRRSSERRGWATAGSPRLAHARAGRRAARQLPSRVRRGGPAGRRSRDPPGRPHRRELERRPCRDRRDIGRGYRGFDPAALAIGSIAEVTDRFGRLAAMGTTSSRSATSWTTRRRCWHRSNASARCARSSVTPA